MLAEQQIVKILETFVLAGMSKSQRKLIEAQEESLTPRIVGGTFNRRGMDALEQLWS